MVVRRAAAVAAIASLVCSASANSEGDEAIAEPDRPAPAAELRHGRMLIAPEAVDPIVVEVFEDAQCPSCQRFTDLIEQRIIAEHVADGTASLTIRDLVIFGDESLDAAIAMRVAEDMDGAFWDYRNVLFHDAATILDDASPRTRLGDLAELIGLDREEFLRRMDDPVYEEAVDEDGVRAQSLGVAALPTVVVDGRMLPAAPAWEEIDAAIEAAIAS